jgi:hypothetical protein
MAKNSFKSIAVFQKDVNKYAIYGILRINSAKDDVKDCFSSDHLRIIYRIQGFFSRFKEFISDQEIN